MHIGDNIKRLRLERKLTLKELADRIGDVHFGTLSNIEKGTHNPSYEMMIKIADALGVTLEYLTRKSVKAIIEDKLEELHMTTEMLSEKTKVPVEFINNLENINPNDGDYEYIRRIAIALNLEPSILKSALAKQEAPIYDNPVVTLPSVDFSPVDISDFVNIPILGSVRAGKPMLAQDNIEGYNLVPKKDLCSDKEYFYLKVQGDSMNQEFNEGTLLLIEKTPWVENGTIAVVLIDGLEATVKKVIQNENMITLIPMSTNPEHLPHMYDVVKDQIQIVGRVKQATKVY